MFISGERGGCFGRGTNLTTESQFLAFNTSHLEYRTLPQLYTFWVVALKGARSGYDHRFLELLANVTAHVAQSSPDLSLDSGEPILVDIVCLSNCLASLDLATTFTLNAVCRSCPPEEELVYKWELSPRDANYTLVEFNLTELGIVVDGSTLTILPFLLGIFRRVQKVELYQLKVTGWCQTRLVDYSMQIENYLDVLDLLDSRDSQGARLHGPQLVLLPELTNWFVLCKPLLDASVQSFEGL